VIDDINLLLSENPLLGDAEIAERLNNDFFILTGRMVSQDMVISLLIRYNSFLSLKGSTSEIAQGFWHAISSGVKEFNLMHGHPVGEAQKSLLNNLLAEGAVTLEFKDAVISYANYSTKKYNNLTEVDVKIARYSPSWKPVTIASGNNQIVTPEGNLINSSGEFRFTLKPTSSHQGSVKIRIYAKSATDSEFKLQESYPININKLFEAGVVSTIVFKRPTGLQGYRHFKFEYLETFDNAMEFIEVEGVV